MSTPTPLAYSLEDAAKVAGYHISTLKRAIDDGFLSKKYANRRPVILHKELEKWLESLPTEPPAKEPQ